ncbi:unnamed protein product [Staurois parvus]|uniref:Uncharacterized protein n=1 Tax=Staurois parvus TaxID=386267 RepID=A0ABN9B7D8_9NEOB|nr:unnamed protein product [Staurois parvus]
MGLVVWQQLGGHQYWSTALPGVSNWQPSSCCCGTKSPIMSACGSHVTVSLAMPHGICSSAPARGPPV